MVPELVRIKKEYEQYKLALKNMKDKHNRKYCEEQIEERLNELIRLENFVTISRGLK